ncbi:MAG: riboflavin synthase [Rubrobacter sp.]
MFTGLVEEAGQVVALESGGMLRMEVEAEVVAEDAALGDSIAVNGVCLTVGGLEPGRLVFFAMDETLRRSAFGGLEEGRKVNLERAMSAKDRFGGHIVQGHVDGVGEVISVVPEGDAEMWTFSAPESVLKYTVEKGSICVDGISLTVVEVGSGGFSVSILPQTKSATDLSELGVGERVNLEADVIGKYVERMVGPWVEKRRAEGLKAETEEEPEKESEKFRITERRV